MKRNAFLLKFGAKKYLNSGSSVLGFQTGLTEIVSVCPLDPVMGMNNIWAAYNLSAL
jgi:hypothetical protein